LSRQFAQVVTGDNISATTTWIGKNGLLVGDRNNGHQSDDGQGDGKSVTEGHGPGQGQDDQVLLGGIGRGRKGIRGEHSQANGLADGLMGHSGRR
jgi:hypothetical protein